MDKTPELSSVSRSKIIYLNLMQQCSQDPENPGHHRVLHDGLITDYDRSIDNAARAFWKMKYLPRYRQSCKEQGLPVIDL
mgnify:CR=1 FL=1